MFDSLTAIPQKDLDAEVVLLYIADYGICDLAYQLTKIEPESEAFDIVIQTILIKIHNEYVSITDSLKPNVKLPISFRTYINKHMPLEVRDVFRTMYTT